MVRRMVEWGLSRGPVGFWLSLTALLAFCPFPYLDTEIFAVAQIFALLLLVTSCAVAALAVMHHERGWEAVRVLSFVGSLTWGALFLTHLFLLEPRGAAVAGVVALGVAAAAWSAVFQYFRRESIERLFPRLEPPRRRR